MDKKTASTIRYCDRQDCGARATSQVALRFWALGESARLWTNCANLLVNVCVCAAHAKDLAPADFLSPVVKEKAGSAIIAAGHRVPDFSTAELNLLPIDGAPLTAEEFISQRHHGA